MRGRASNALMMAGGGPDMLPPRGGFTKGKVLLVNDIPQEIANTTALFNLFSLYGQVTKIQVMKSLDKALIEMGNPRDGMNGKRYLDGVVVCGQKLSVSPSNKPYLEGHLDDANFHEFSRGQRCERGCIPPSPMLIQLTLILASKLFCKLVFHKILRGYHIRWLHVRQYTLLYTISFYSASL